MFCQSDCNCFHESCVSGKIDHSVLLKAVPLVLCGSAIDCLVQEFQSSLNFLNISSSSIEGEGVVVNKLAGSNNDGSDCPVSTGLTVLV